MGGLSNISVEQSTCKLGGETLTGHLLGAVRLLCFLPVCLVCQSASSRARVKCRMSTSQAAWSRTLLLLLLQHSSKRSLVSGCQSMQLAARSTSRGLLPFRRKHHPPYCTDIIQVSLQLSVHFPRHPVSTVGPPSGLAHPSQQVWLSHAHHETPERSKISGLDGRSIHNNPRASCCLSLVGVAPAEALAATGGLPSSSPKSRDPRHA